MKIFPSTEQLKLIQRRTAVGAITPSALRNIVGEGSVHAAIEELGKLSLEDFATFTNEEAFVDWLDRSTEHLRTLMTPMPPQTQAAWGAARKCLNIFLFECLLNRFIYDHYKEGLDRITPWLEIPLDSFVGEKMKEKIDPSLPTWPSVKWIEPAESKLFQISADRYAVKNGIARVYVELELWRAE